MITQKLITPTSAVIVRHNRGYVAHVRFADKQFDIDLSSKSKHYLYELIESYCERVNI